MVRVVSQNFSPPRSRHSSGDTDRDLAERANLALSVVGRKRFETSEYESSSDSFWDSEFDGDQCEALVSENGSTCNDINGNETPEKSDVQSKRKERRRERNKLSAQAYRQRRRTQSVKEQQTLMELEAENKRLHRLVQTLEKKTEDAKNLLRCCPPPISVLQPIGELEGATADMPDTDLDLTVSQAADPFTSQLFASHSRDVPLSFPLHSHPTPLLPPTSLVNKFANTSVKNVSPQPVPILAKHKAPNMTYPTPIKTTPVVCPPLPPSQFIFNANVLIGATLSSSGVTNLTTVPAILTVPIENPTTNLNCNPLRPCPPGTHSTTNPSTYLENETNHTKPAGDSSSVFNTVWWNGNQLKPNGNPVTGTLVGLVSMELYNNNNMNGNISGNDANGNNSGNKSVSRQSHPSTQPMSFNLNLNQAAGLTHQEVLCQEQGQPPVMPVQCFLASDTSCLSSKQSWPKLEPLDK